MPNVFSRLAKKSNRTGNAAMLVASTAAPVVAAVASDVLNVTIPGAQALSATANQINEIYQQIKANKEECGEIAERTRDIMKILVNATLTARQEDLSMALLEDIKGFETELVEIKDSMITMAARGIVQRTLNRAKDAEQLQKYLESLRNAQRDFSILNAIGIRLFQNSAHKKNMQAHRLHVEALEETDQKVVKVKDSLSRTLILAARDDPTQQNLKFTYGYYALPYAALTAFFFSTPSIYIKNGVFNKRVIVVFRGV